MGLDPSLRKPHKDVIRSDMVAASEKLKENRGSDKNKVEDIYNLNFEGAGNGI